MIFQDSLINIKFKIIYIFFFYQIAFDQFNACFNEVLISYRQTFELLTKHLNGNASYFGFQRNLNKYCSGLRLLTTYRLTCLRTESISLVTVVIFGSGTPTVPIIPAWGGATIIFFPLKCEGELTRSSICISTQCEHDCNTGRNKNQWVSDYDIITVMMFHTHFFPKLSLRLCTTLDGNSVKLYSKT